MASSASLSLELNDGLLVGSEIDCSQVEVWHVVEGLESTISQDENLEVFTLFNGLFDFGGESTDFYLRQVEFNQLRAVSFLFDEFLNGFKG